MEPTRKLRIHFVYKKCTRCNQLMYTKNIQNLYKMYTTFQQTFAYILYTKLKEQWQLNFVYKIYTKICRNVGYFLYTNILCPYCILFYIQKVHIIKIMSTVCIQNSCRICIQIIVCKMDPTFQDILIRLLCTS